MKILGLEFSSAVRSVALGDVDASREDAASGCINRGLAVSREHRGDSFKPFALIEQVLRQAGVAQGSVGCVAVGLGPGSYAGIRTAIAVAQGWQLASAIQTMGINSVLCLAHQVQATGYTGLLDVAVDAQREEYYLASYHLAPGVFKETSPLHLASRAEVQSGLDAGHRLAGPNLSPWFPNAIDLAPCASMICQLAGASSGAVLAKAEQFEPIYLRQTAFVKAPKPRPY